MRADEAASRLITAVRARPWGLAAAALVAEDVQVAFDEGSDPFNEDTVFQIGSVTKTMTGDLLAWSVGAGEASFDTTLGEILDIGGPASAVTLLELATQRSGLPRLPPNLDLTTIDQADPYAEYSEADLRVGLEQTTPGGKDHAYSNFGFMALGLAIQKAAGRPFAEVLRVRIFEPLGMTSAGCPPAEDQRVQGYAGQDPTVWWRTQLPGPGGVGASIRDLCAYLRGHIDPPKGDLGAAVTLATTIHGGEQPAMGLGWNHQGGGWWHNGGTGGFSTFVAFHRPTRTAVALLANAAQQNGPLDAVGFKILTELVRSNS